MQVSSGFDPGHLWLDTVGISLAKLLEGATQPTTLIG
jgi:hypothetical protein